MQKLAIVAVCSIACGSSYASAEECFSGVAAAPLIQAQLHAQPSLQSSDMTSVGTVALGDNSPAALLRPIVTAALAAGTPVAQTITAGAAALAAATERGAAIVTAQTNQGSVRGLAPTGDSAAKPSGAASGLTPSGNSAAAPTQDGARVSGSRWRLLGRRAERRCQRPRAAGRFIGRGAWPEFGARSRGVGRFGGSTRAGRGTRSSLERRFVRSGSDSRLGARPHWVGCVAGGGTGF